MCTESKKQRERVECSATCLLLAYTERDPRGDRRVALEDREGALRVYKARKLASPFVDASSRSVSCALRNARLPRKFVKDERAWLNRVSMILPGEFEGEMPGER